MISDPPVELNIPARRKQTRPRRIQAAWDEAAQMLEIRTSHGNFATTVLLTWREFALLTKAMERIVPDGTDS
jgi:hypothetical protein